VKDIELRHQGMTVALLRELAGIRVGVPSNPDCPVDVQNELRERVRELAHAIEIGPKLPRSEASLAASDRTYS
jgi:hypothetical protein